MFYQLTYAYFSLMNFLSNVRHICSLLWILLHVELKFILQEIVQSLYVIDIAHD